MLINIGYQYNVCGIKAFTCYEIKCSGLYLFGALGKNTQILSWAAQDERERIRKRQREGNDAALRQGKPYGRPKVQMTEAFLEAYHEWRQGNLTAVQAMEQSGVKKTTFYKFAKQME